MNTKLSFRAAALGVAALFIGAAGIAAGDEPATAPTRAASAAPTPVGQQAEKPVTLDRERGIVIEGDAVLDGEPVGISLYENATHGNVLQVFFPDTDEVGAVEQDAPFVVDGRVDVTVDVDGRSVRLAGVVTETGATEAVEPTQHSEQTVTGGTHAILDADLAVTVGDYSVPLESAGFAFDLDVTRSSLDAR